MTYASELAALSRTPVTFCKMTLDYCSRTFGTSPCYPTGPNLLLNGAYWYGANGIAPPSNWTDLDVTVCSIYNGYLKISGDPISTRGFTQEVAVETGKWYRVTASAYKSFLGGNAQVKIGTTSGASDIALLETDSITAVVLSQEFQATTASVFISIVSAASFPLAGVASFDNVVLIANDHKCYNTFETCRDRTNYAKSTKEYKFTTADAKLPFKSGERPYIKSISYMPTEIKDELTVKARTTIELYDEPDTDIGIDPYYATRSSIQGTFWKKLLARNPNYKGRYVNIYEGFSSLAEVDFVQKFVGVIDNITMGRGSVKIEVVDLLKALEKVDIPPKLDVKLAIDVAIDALQMTLSGTDLTSLDDPLGYVRIGDEIIKYEAINTTTGIISTCTRGVFSTTAATHSAKDKVQKVRYYAPDDPFQQMIDILGDAGTDLAYVDTDAYTDALSWPAGDLDMSAVISEPTKASDPYWELVNLLGCKSWVGEDLKITIARDIPNRPGRTYTTFTDDENIKEKSASVDLNQASLITRCSIYWDKATVAKEDEKASYNRLDVAVDASAEGVNEYNESSEKEILTRWLQTGLAEEGLLAHYVQALALRHVYLHRDPMPLLTFDAELKDSAIATGDYAKITMDELLGTDGNELTAEHFQIVKREQSENTITLKALRLSGRRIMCVAPAGTPVYASATAAQKEYGFISGADGRMTDDSQPYVIW